MTPLLYPWQQRQWQQLLSLHQQERLPHALLLAGPAGLGKRIFAEQFAHYLLCKTPVNDSACGQCAGCHLTSAHNHPDLLNIFPEEKGKNIKIDSIRQMILTLNQTAQRAGYQVVIIAPSDALNKAGANALLKTLEEPIGKVVLLLVSDQPSTLPATITSRCQKITFTGSREANIWLTQKLEDLNISADADLFLKIAEYAPLRALELANNHYLTLRDELLVHLLALTQQKTQLLAPVAHYLEQDLIRWVDAFISLVVDMIRLHLGVKASALTNPDRLSQLQQLKQCHPLLTLPPFLTQLHQARQSLLNSQIHLNEQLLLESLLIHWEITQCFS